MSSGWIPHSQPTLGEPEARAVYETVLAGNVGAGNGVRELERRVAEYTERAFAIATSSGSAALTLALRALSIGQDAQVIVPALGCRALLNAVMTVQAQPMPADIDEADLTLSLQAAIQCKNSNTRAVILPDMFGAPADVCAFETLGVPIIHDAASSQGARFDGKPIEHFGTVAILSFGSTKMMTSASGGMVLTDDASLANEIRALLDYDGVTNAKREDGSYRIGTHEGMNDLAASLGLAQWNAFPQRVARRKAIAQAYSDAFQTIGHIRLPQVREKGEHGFYRYIVWTQQLAAPLTAAFREREIDARSSVTHYLYDYLGLDEQTFPHCENVRGHLVSLPIYPALTEADVNRIIETASAIFEGHA